MFDALLRMLTGSDDDRRPVESGTPEFALALLMIEVARSDDRIEAREENVIARALMRRFGLDRSEVASLVAAAKEGVLQTADLFHFTRTVTEAFNETERGEVIEMLWEIAYADGILSPDEDMLIRRIAGLIYVDDVARGEARRRALARLGKAGAVQESQE